MFMDRNHLSTDGTVRTICTIITICTILPEQNDSVLYRKCLTIHITIDGPSPPDCTCHGPYDLYHPNHLYRPT